MKHLLVVEDNPNTLSGLVTLLGDEGYDVDGVMQGTEALAVAAEKPVDMVLCDFNLPDTNGLQVCQRLKKINHNVNLCGYPNQFSTKTFCEIRCYKVCEVPAGTEFLKRCYQNLAYSFCVYP